MTMTSFIEDDVDDDEMLIVSRKIGFTLFEMLINRNPDRTD